MSKEWTPLKILLVAGGTIGAGVVLIVALRRLVDNKTIPLPSWMPLPLLPGWIPGAPSIEDEVEPEEQSSLSTYGGGMTIGYKRGQQIQVDLADIGGGQQLEARAANSFIAMRDAAARDGVSLKVNMSFRDMETQTELRRLYESKAIDPKTGKPYALAAKPGWSNHQAGTALDLQTANGTNDAFRWMNKNGSKYGWRRTVTSEPWHWEWFAPTTSQLPVA